MKSGPYFKQTPYTPAKNYATFGGLRDSAQDLKQRALSSSIPTDDANHLAPADLKTHISKRPNLFQVGTWNDGPALQQVSRLMPDAPGVAREHIPQSHITGVCGLVTDDVFLAKIFGFNDDVAHVRLEIPYMRSANVFSILRNRLIPNQRKNATAAMLRTKPGQYRGLPVPRMHQRKPSITPAMGFRL